MTFVYTYRSSDGLRHSAEIEAESRDQAFSKIRTELGIKPIKVVATDFVAEPSTKGSNGNNRPQLPYVTRSWLLDFRILILVIAAATLAFLIGRDGGIRLEPETQKRTSVRYRVKTVKRFKKLLQDAMSVKDDFNNRYEELDIRRLTNYELIDELSDVTTLYKLASDGHFLISQTKQKIKALFTDLREIFPPESINELNDAQKLYGELMAALEAKEIALSNKKYALVLLDGNRGKWKCHGGKVSFSDKRLDELFKYCLQGARESDVTTVRWNRDFGTPKHPPALTK